MNTSDQNVTLVELVAEALGPLCDELVLVGGCAVGLLITDRARPIVRATVDVDLIAEVTSLSDYYALTRRLPALGFHPDDEIIIRHRKGSLIVDIMPDREVGQNFTNRWYPLAVKCAERVALPSGREIKLITAPLFVATKLESFHGRGQNDYLHHDMEDIVNLVDGRPELFDEVMIADGAVRDYIMQEVDDLLADRLFTDQLPCHLNPDLGSQGRLGLIIGRLRKLAGL